MSKFKVLLIVLALVFPTQSSSMECGEYPVMEYRSSDGKRTGLEITKEMMVGSEKWSPSSGEPPLTISRASKIAQEYASSKWLRFDEIRIKEITLVGWGCWSDQGYWYYNISFTPVLDGNKIYATKYFIGLLMNETIVEPKEFK